MAAWAAAAPQAAKFVRFFSPKSFASSTNQAANLIQRRGLAGGGDHHGPPKVNCWQDPMSPSKWKEEHFVIVSLYGWGLLFFSGYKFFTGEGRRRIPLSSTFILLTRLFLVVGYSSFGDFVDVILGDLRFLNV
ncbi:hypothetical protein NMG60_11002322 [Bertholletia excelsa]